MSDATVEPLKIVHAVLMCTGWCVLLPLGVLFARFGRSKSPTTGPRAWWFIRHQVFQYSGLACVIAGLAVAVYMKTGDHFTRLHEKLGLAVMICAVLQPLNAWIRPPPRPLTLWRKLWSFWHQSVGYGVLGVAYVTIYFGLRLLEVTAADVAAVAILVAFLILWTSLLASKIMLIVRVSRASGAEQVVVACCTRHPAVVMLVSFDSSKMHLTLKAATVANKSLCK